MEQVVDDSGVGFICRHDGTSMGYRPQDLRLAGGGGEGHSSRVADLHKATLRHAANDPTTARVPYPCPDCKLPYLRQVIVGERSASAFYVCTCGYEVSGKSYGDGRSSEKELAALERAGWKEDGVAPPGDGAEEAKTGE